MVDPDGGHLDRAFARYISSKYLTDDTPNRGTRALIPKGPDDTTNEHLTTSRPSTYQQEHTDHSAESDVLAGWAAGRDVQPGDPYLRLNYAIAFIAGKGMAGEFAKWLRSQE